MSFLNPTYIISILIALSVHEAAHAFMADRLGDSTARYAGRLTLNPIAHLDLLGSLLFLTVGFGWGKPVPVDPRNFKNWKRDNALVAFAGPCSNLILAAIAFIGLRIVDTHVQSGSIMDLLEGSMRTGVTAAFFLQLFTSSLFINLGLMAFNLLPIAPLDGSKVLEAFVPLRFDDAYQNFMRRGPMILLVLLVAERLLNVPFLLWWITWISDAVLSVMNTVVRIFS